MQTKLKVAAKAILHNNGKVLIVSDKDVWDFPGGGIEGSERLEDALQRELQEELGLKHVTIDRLIHVDEWFIEKTDHQLHVVAIFYQCQVESQFEPELSDEHQKAAWILPSKLSDYNVTADTTKALEKAKDI